MLTRLAVRRHTVQFVSAHEAFEGFVEDTHPYGRCDDRDLKSSTLINFEVYEEAFAKMQAATGISDIDELVENFINAEDQNFSLFTSFIPRELFFHFLSFYIKVFLVCFIVRF